MEVLIYKIKRFLFSLKVRARVRRRTRKSSKIWRKVSYRFQMAAYDTEQTRKAVRQSQVAACDMAWAMKRCEQLEREEGDK